MTEPLILYATMTGNAEEAAHDLARQLEARGTKPRLETMQRYHPQRLAEENLAFLLTSTFGNGDPPDGAFAFWDLLRKADDLRLDGLSFGVAAFGDSSYPRFCQFGRDLDARLVKLGGKRLVEVALCDVDWEDPFAAWSTKAMAELERAPGGE